MNKFITLFMALLFIFSVSCVNINSDNKKETSKNKKLLPPFEAIATWVIDGDSFTAKSHGIKIKVRLYGIDSPEKKQPFGRASLAHLIKLIKYKRLIIEPIENDKYGRMIAKIYTFKKVKKKLVKTYINLKQVEAGYAWHYKRYAKNEKDLAQAEATARKQKKGLWIQKKPINPETFRYKKKNL